MVIIHQSQNGAKAYDSLSKSMQYDHFTLLISNLEIKENMKIVDVGCGTRYDTAELSKMVGKDREVIGIDPMKERIQIACENYQNCSNLKFFAFAFGHDAPMFGNNFDLVIASHVIHWIPTAEKPETFKSIAHSLKNGGKFAFVCAMPIVLTESVFQLFSLISDDILACAKNNTYFESKETFH